MSWFSRRQPKAPKPAGLAPPGLATGLHRSPGLGILSAELEKRPPRAILDLGASSTETVRFLSRFCDNIHVQDLFHSSETRSGVRSTIFRFDDEALEALSEAQEAFDVVLIWDLLHYFERPRLASFVARLAAGCRDDALVFLLASAIAPIPLTPIRFKIHDRETLHYQLPSDDRVASPMLRTRDVEQIMEGFTPLRLFQLRNGLQEFLFRYAGVAPESASESQREAGDAVAGQVAEVEKPPGLLG